MTKNYLYSTLLFIYFFTIGASAQESNTIEGLNLYPNPVSNGKVYISTKNDSDKEIQIFDVLGKKVLQTFLSSRELNISALAPGVYIIKIREEEASATRKLIVR